MEQGQPYKNRFGEYVVQEISLDEENRRVVRYEQAGEIKETFEDVLIGIHQSIENDGRVFPKEKKQLPWERQVWFSEKKGK